MNNSNNTEDHSYSWGSRFIDKHPVMANIVIIAIVSLLGLYAIYLTIALFTKHGRTVQVPSVENMSYTEAINKLHKQGLKVDIRDSLYREDVKPGYVIEQFPKANSIVKPERKIFLYINAVHPKEVIIDDDNHPGEYALRGESYRSAQARLEELGFKNIRMVKVLGVSDRVVKIMANGKPIRKMQKVPITSNIVMEVSDGRLNELQDSLRNAELLEMYRQNPVTNTDAYDEYGNSTSGTGYEEAGSSYKSVPIEEPGQQEETSYF